MRSFSSWAAAGAMALAACGGATLPQASGNTSLILIEDLRYIPQDLAVAPGATVIVRNDDLIAHSVTSEPSAGAFTPGAVAGISFDTGELTGGITIIEIPADAADGTVVPYYCTVHKQAMTTPEGSITIRAAQ